MYTCLVWSLGSSIDNGSWRCSAQDLSTAMMPWAGTMASHAASTAAVWFSCSMLYIDHHVAGCHFSGYVWIPAKKKEFHISTRLVFIFYRPSLPYPHKSPSPHSNAMDGRIFFWLTVACLRICCRGCGTFGSDNGTSTGVGGGRRRGGQVRKE